MKSQSIQNQWRPFFGVFWAVLLGFLAFSYAMFQGGFVSWFLFYSMMPILLYTLLIALYPLRTVKVEREIAEPVFAANSSAKVNVRIQRPSRFPLFYLIVTDVVPEPLRPLVKKSSRGYPGFRGLFFPGLKKTFHLTYELTHLPRGEYTFKNCEIQTGDLFGLIHKRAFVRSDTSFLVYPSPQSLEQWHSLQYHDEGKRRGNRSLQYDMTSVAGVRDYAPGDRLTWLNWKALAKNGKLLTKEFDRPLNEDVMMILDRQRTGYDDPQEFEQAVIAAASVTAEAIRRGMNIGLISYGRDHTNIPLHTGEEQRWKILYHLARVEPDGRRPLATVLEKAYSPSGAASTSGVVLITARIDAETLQFIHRILRRKKNVDLFYTGRKQNRALGNERLYELLRQAGVHVYVLRHNRFILYSEGGSRDAESAR